MSFKSACGWLSVLATFAVVGLAPQSTRAAAAPPAAAISDGRAYAIKLTRAVKVGDTCNFVADATVVQSMTANVSGRERTLRPVSLWLHLEATERVLAVNAQGEPSKATYTIRKCVTRKGKSGETPYLDPGAVLTVDAGRWKSRIRLDEGSLTVDQEMALRSVISLPSLKDVSADDAYGTQAPRKVGDSWPVNADAMARFVSREGVRVDKRHVSGTVKLKGVQTVDGVPCLLLQGKVVVEHWTPDPSDLPPETKFMSGSDEIKFTKLLPVDPSGQCLTDSGSEKALMKVRTDDQTIGPEILVDAKVLRTIGIKRTPVKVEPDASGRE